MSSRLPGGTRQLRWTLNPECTHPGALGRQESLLHQKRDDPCAEEFLQRREVRLGHHMEKPAVHKEPVGHERVEVRVKIQVFAEAVDRHYDARRALGQSERGALELNEAAVGDGAEFLDEAAMEAEIGGQHFGNREREMPVRHRREDRLCQQRAEKLHLLLVARRAEPPAPCTRTAAGIRGRSGRSARGRSRWRNPRSP